MREAFRLALGGLRLVFEGLEVALGRRPRYERIQVCALCGADTPEERVAFAVADLAVCEGCQGESAPVS